MIRELQVAAAFFLLATGCPAHTIKALLYTPAYSTNNTFAPLWVCSGGEDDVQVSCTRTVSAGSRPASVRVRITIHKGATAGFARYSDVLPKGVQVESVITDGSSFSIADGKVRFVWVSAPAKEILNIEYTLTGTGTTPIKLKGEFSYVEGNSTKKFELPAETVDVTRLEKPASNEIPDKKGPVPALPAPEKKGRQSKKESTERAPSGIVFKVQVGAFRSRRASAARLKKRFRLSAPLVSEKSDGFTRFMTGQYSSYDEARHRKDEIVTANGIVSAFVVAYKDGKRITVTEARELTRQKQNK